jgi:hypothetical protein
MENMSASQKRAVENHRRRLNERGLARYEVRGLEKDKDLVRQFAKRLAANDAEAERLREAVTQRASKGPQTGKDIWEALRRSPLIGLDLDIEREFTTGRDVDP